MIQEKSFRYQEPGSYLSRLLAKKFFLPAGDIEDLMMETLTFAEFTEAFRKRELYDSIDLFGQSDPAKYM